MNTNSYFSISFNLIPTNQVLGYDLYVNSSSVDKKQKFIRIFASDDSFDQSDLDEFRKKYHQLYIAESQRDLYLQSLSKVSGVDKSEVVNVIKDSAIEHLHNLFGEHAEFSNELLSDSIKKSKVAVESMIDVLDDVNVSALTGLIGNLSAHDFYTYDHSINVSMYCIGLLKLMKPQASRLELVHAGLGGLLHDLGKVKIPTKILNSPDGLTDDEYKTIKTHPQLGIDLLLSGEIEVDDELDLETIGRVIHEHHENVDGTGYPSKKSGDDIHLLARICAIVDFFDAITTKRSYADVMPLNKALTVMKNTCGKKIDEKIFEIFSNHLKFKEVDGEKTFEIRDPFDPSIPFKKFPVEEIKKMFNDKDFGKIKMLDQKKKKK